MKGPRYTRRTDRGEILTFDELMTAMALAVSLLIEFLRKRYKSDAIDSPVFLR